MFDPIELQAMLDSGSITAAEYDRLRLALAKRAEAEPLRGAGGFEVLPVVGQFENGIMHLTK